jgi:hypothetical protein
MDVLDRIKIASPCSAKWELMKGDDQVRFCGQCHKHVYNLSAMTRRDGETLLRETNGRICTRFYRRSDGTILTEDCPVGLKARAVRVRRRLSLAISGTLGLSTAFAQSNAPEGVHIRLEESLQAELFGTVTDQTGANIVGARVTVTDLETHRENFAQTNPEGQFRLKAENEASYQLKVEMPGFRSTTVPRVYIVAKHRRIVDVTLLLGTMGGPMEVK